jgi:hypothetical protein
MPEKTDDQYWANKPIDEIGGEIMQRVEDFDSHLLKYGRLRLYRRVYENMYMADRTGGEVYTSGDQDEFLNVDVADFRNIVQHLTVMTTSQRAAFEPRATNTDSDAQAQTILASGLLEYYLRVKKLERFTNKATENSVAYGEGFVRLDWNPMIGDDYAVDPKTKKKVKAGEIAVKNYMSHNVIRDITADCWESLHWWVCRDFEDRHVLAAAHPTLSAEILEVSMGDKIKQMTMRDNLLEDTDRIPVYTFIHKKNEATPLGRIVRLISPEVILADAPQPSKESTLYRIAPVDQEGTTWGWTVMFDLLPLQEALKKLYSTVATNHANFGVQNLTAPKGHGIEPDRVRSGRRSPIPLESSEHPRRDLQVY